MNYKSLIIFLLFLLIIVLAWVGYAVKNGYMPGPAYPTAPSATSTGGQQATTTGSANTDNSIRVTAPLPNALVISPLAISGTATNAWYFEGSFPVELVDSAGHVLAKAPAHAEGDWTRPGPIAFTLKLQFPKPTTTPTGLLIFKNDNPSGDPARDIIFAIPVRFR